MKLSPHVIDFSNKHERIVGTVTPGCNYPQDNGWDWSAPFPGLAVVSGCGHDAITCTLKPTSGTGTYQVGCINGANTQGPWTSCDYYGVLGKGCFQLTGEVTGDSGGEGGVNVYALGSGRGGSAVTDPSGHYTIILCHKGLYNVFADDHLIQHTGGPFALSSYIFTRFKPESGDCASAQLINLRGCAIYVRHDEHLDFGPLFSQTFVSQQPQAENPGSHLMTQSEKASMRNFIDADNAVSAVTGGMALAATLVPEPFVSKAAAVDLGVVSFTTLTEASVLYLVVNYVDPFDPNYAVIATPEHRSPPRLNYGSGAQRQVLRALVGATLGEVEVERAADITLNRLASAQQVKDVQAVDAQRQAAVRYLRKLATLTASVIRDQRRLAALLGRKTVSLSRRVRDRASASVSTTALAEQLSSLGIDPGQALSTVASMPKVSLPRRARLAALVASPRLLRAETRAEAILKAAAKNL